MTHDNEPVRKFGNLFHDHQLVWIWLAQHGVQRRNHRHLQVAQQIKNMASGGAAEDSIFVLQAHHVDVVEVQEFGGFVVRSYVFLGE